MSEVVDISTKINQKMKVINDDVWKDIEIAEEKIELLDHILVCLMSNLTKLFQLQRC